MHEDVRAEPGQPHGGLEADAARRAGDQDRAAVHAAPRGTQPRERGTLCGRHGVVHLAGPPVLARRRRRLPAALSGHSASRRARARGRRPSPTRGATTTDTAAAIRRPPSSGCAATCGSATIPRSSPPRRPRASAAAGCCPSTSGSRAERRAWAPGGAARWWLWHSLRSLDGDLRRLGSRLLLERGDPAGRVLELAAQLSAGAVVWAGGLEPDETADDAALVEALRARGIAAALVPAGQPARRPAQRAHTRGPPVHRVHAVLARPPRGRRARGAAAGAGRAACCARRPGRPLSRGARSGRPSGRGRRSSPPVWRPGETGAQARLERFLDGPLGEYAADRDRPTSRGARGSRRTCTGAS